MKGDSQVMTEAEHITRALGGRWAGRTGTARCPAHDDREPSLSLSTGRGGGLLLHCHAGCDFRDVLDALRGRGLVEGRSAFREPDPARVARQRAAEEAEARKREGQALACWRETVPVTGTLAETYLRARGIACDLPECLRFHPACWHPSAQRLPSMVARIDRAERFAVHRTYLRGDGRAKAEADPPRAMLGAVAGGAVRLTEAHGPLVVAEGIETALSLASGLLRGPACVWAALSTGGMAGLRLPPVPGRLTVATDGDAPGRTAGNALAERASALGWAVNLLPAPEGRDWNDILTRKGATA